MKKQVLYAIASRVRPEWYKKRLELMERPLQYTRVAHKIFVMVVTWLLFSVIRTAPWQALFLKQHKGDTFIDTAKPIESMQTGDGPTCEDAKSLLRNGDMAGTASGNIESDQNYE